MPAEPQFETPGIKDIRNLGGAIEPQHIRGKEQPIPQTITDRLTRKPSVSEVALYDEGGGFRLSGEQKERRLVGYEQTKRHFDHNIGYETVVVLDPAKNPLRQKFTIYNAITGEVSSFELTGLRDKGPIKRISKDDEGFWVHQNFFKGPDRYEAGRMVRYDHEGRLDLTIERTFVARADIIRTLMERETCTYFNEKGHVWKTRTTQNRFEHNGDLRASESVDIESPSGLNGKGNRLERSQTITKAGDEAAEHIIVEYYHGTERDKTMLVSRSEEMNRYRVGTSQKLYAKRAYTEYGKGLPRAMPIEESNWEYDGRGRKILRTDTVAGKMVGQSRYEYTGNDERATKLIRHNYRDHTIYECEPSPGVQADPDYGVKVIKLGEEDNLSDRWNIVSSTRMDAAEFLTSEPSSV